MSDHDLESRHWLSNYILNSAFGRELRSALQRLHIQLPPPRRRGVWRTRAGAAGNGRFPCEPPVGLPVRGCNPPLGVLPRPDVERACPARPPNPSDPWQAAGIQPGRWIRRRATARRLQTMKHVDRGITQGKIRAGETIPIYLTNDGIRSSEFVLRYPRHGRCAG